MTEATELTPPAAAQREAGERYPLVQLKFTIRVMNHSDADVSQARIDLDDFFFGTKKRPLSKSVNFKQGDFVLLSNTMLVPKQDYERWQQGSTPYVFIEYRDPAGNNKRDKITLSRLPGLERSSH